MFIAKIFRFDYMVVYIIDGATIYKCSHVSKKKKHR